jgi:methanogenesis imperfect marker protein 11
MSKILSPDELTERFGKLFCKGVVTLVDESNGVAQIIENCIAKGPVEWDAVNRKRAGGAITDVRVEGTTLIMDTIIGEREVRFGPASKDLGGQGLKAFRVEGDRVKTTWVGLAGASVGIGVCLPQGPGTLEAEYPDDFKIGGSHAIEVTITTLKMVRVVFAVDDTDTKEKGASWVMMLKAARGSPFGHFLEHKIIQLNPNVPEKTTNCVSVGISFAVEERDLQKLIDYVVKYVKENTLSKNTTLAVFQGLRIPQDLVDYGLQAKKTILTVDRARDVAERSGVRLVEITGERGTIGAVAGIGCFDLGIRSASLPEDFEK